ncbi:MAG: GNAT family N-acetyltransferase [Roseiarcus sp.]
MIEPTESLLTLRLARDNADDVAFLFALFAATRSPEMEVMPIDAKAKDFLLRAQYRSMTETYRREYPNARWEVVEIEGEPAGLLVTDVGSACVTYVDIAILPHVQRRGLARRVMLKALEEPRLLGLPARVSVLMHNVASLRLCERVGFVRAEESPPFVRLEWTA